jgi:hypothetical protein
METERYVRVEAGRLESAERRATSYFEAMLRANDQNEKLRKAMLAFVNAYANVETLDHDQTEIKLFQAWLQGCAALGIGLPKPKRSPVETPT